VWCYIGGMARRQIVTRPAIKLVRYMDDLPWRLI
jgi:hypothetical protein